MSNENNIHNEALGAIDLKQEFPDGSVVFEVYVEPGSKVPSVRERIMSKELRAEVDQGYKDRPIYQTCSNCAHCKQEDGKNLHCGIGGFVVNEAATCRLHAENESGAA